MEQGDVLNLRDVTVVDWPEVATWPVTTILTRVELRLTGVHVEFSTRDGPDRWPDHVTPGWSGPLQYSLGLALQIAGTWYAAAPIEFWHGLEESGGQIQAQNVEGSKVGQIPKNWFYDARWGPLHGYQPQPEELVGVYVCAGDVRNRVSVVKERSEILLVRLPPEGVARTVVGPMDISPPEPPPPARPPRAPDGDDERFFSSLERIYDAMAGIADALLAMERRLTSLERDGLRMKFR